MHNMKFAYADPPYFGLGAKYKKEHPNALDCNNIEWHHNLIDSLSNNYPDGWALSLTSPNLKKILPLCPDDVRIGAWVKPFCSYKPGVNPAYAWEPIIFRGGRKLNRDTNTCRDWVSANITLKKGLVGAKPVEFSIWLLKILGWQHGDEIDDLFPGTGGVAEAWNKYTKQITFF